MGFIAKKSSRLRTVPKREMSPDEKLVKRINDDIKEASEALKPWLDESQKCQRNYDNHQWDDEDREVNEKNKKPTITFNRIKPVVRAVAGMEIMHRRRMIFLPRQSPRNKSQAMSDAATYGVDWALELARAPHERWRAFRDMIIRGVGCVSYGIAYDEDPNGRATVNRVCSWETGWDPSARQQNLEDAKWVYRRRKWTKEEIEDEFDVDMSTIPMADAGDGRDGGANQDAPLTIINSHPDLWRDGAQTVKGMPRMKRRERNSYWVTQYEFYDLEPFYRVREEVTADKRFYEICDQQEIDPDMLQPGSPEEQKVLQLLADEGWPPEELTVAGPGAAMGAMPQPGMAGPGLPMVAPGAPGAPDAGPGGGLPLSPPPEGAPIPVGAPGMDAGDAPDGPAAPPAPPSTPQGLEGPLDSSPEEDTDVPEPERERWLSLSLDEYETLVQKLEMLGEPPPEAVQLKRRAYKRAFVTGKKLLRQEDMFIPSFSLKFMTGEWDDEDEVWYGLVRSMIDPQKGINKWVSQGIHHFNAGAKGALLIEAGAVVNPKSLLTDWNKPNSIITFKADMLSQQRFQVVEPAPFPEAAAKMIEYSSAALHDVIGVNVEFMGQSQGDESSVTVQKRQSQAITILADVFDSLTRFRAAEAYTMLEIVKKFLSQGRWIRIAGPYAGKRQHIKLLEEDFAAEYDLQLDDVPTDPNGRDRAFEQIQGLLPMMQRMGKIPDAFKDLFPLPASAIAGWKREEAKAAAAEQPPPPKKEEDPRWVEAEIRFKNAQALLLEARAKGVSRESVMGMFETAQDIDLQKMEIELRKEELAIQRAELEIHKNVKAREMKVREDESTLNAVEADRKLTNPNFPGE